MKFKYELVKLVTHQTTDLEVKKIKIMDQLDGQRDEIIKVIHNVIKQLMFQEATISLSFDVILLLILTEFYYLRENGYYFSILFVRIG